MSTYSTKYFPDSSTKFRTKFSASGGGGGEVGVVRVAGLIRH